MSTARRNHLVASFREEPHRWLDVAPHRLAYRKFGDGPDIVFVHGWPLTSATFRGLVPLLADRFTCHLIDLPGSGQTQSPDGAPLDFGSQARVVRGAVDRLGLNRYALLAHDSGGLIARLVAAEDRRVATLVLGSTEIPGHTPALIEGLLAAAHSPGGAEALRQQMQARDVRRSDAAYGGCFANPDFLDGEFHDLLVEPILSSPARWAKQIAILQTIDDSTDAALRGAHAQITAPMLFVWGDADPIFPLAKAGAMVDELGQRARLAIIPGAKLFAHEDHPDGFAASARPFLESTLT
jgi:pimeloyl-ACP methyl ester carboxylesterase